MSRVRPDIVLYDKLSRQTTAHRAKPTAQRKADADRFYDEEPGE